MIKEQIFTEKNFDTENSTKVDSESKTNNFIYFQHKEMMKK